MRRSRPVAFAIFTVVATAVLLEVALRVGALVVDPERPEASQGVTPDRAAYRIAAVGDSWVFGAEAPRGQGFVDVVEQELPALLGRPVQVVNRGRNGGNSAHAVGAALDLLPALEPDAVVVLVGLNDGQNLQGVAELVERLGAGRQSPGVHLRTLQALRIGAANLRAIRGARPVPEIPPMKFLDDGACVHGNFSFGTAADWTVAMLCRGTPRIQAPLLDSPAGRGYIDRFVDEDPPPSDDSLDDLAYSVLYAAARGDVDQVARRVEALEAEAQRPIRGARDVRARYALLRAAREIEDWAAIRRHGGALDAWPERSLLRDLGAAEARILAGDWRTARALLLSAHNRAPGFADVVDAASRFPQPARDGRVHDAIEWPWTRRSLRREVERVHSIPGPYYTPELADELQRAVAAATPGTTPAPDAGPREWRLHLAAHLGRGGQEFVGPAVREFSRSDARDDVTALRYAVLAMVAVGGCEQILEVADRWYDVRGDAHGWVRAVSGCLSPAASAERLAVLREAWGPLGAAADWDALTNTRSEDGLLEAHLDALHEAVGPATRVLVLTYPNPDPAFEFHQLRLRAWAAGRDVELIDLRETFRDRFSASEWDALIASHGHCNAAGYRVMGLEVARQLSHSVRSSR